MNDDIKNHISLWLPAPAPVSQTVPQRRLRSVLPVNSMLPALPQHWLSPQVSRLSPDSPTSRLAA